MFWHQPSPRIGLATRSTVITLNTNTAAHLSQLMKTPVLRHSARTLEELRGRKSTSAIHLIRALERDPALCCDLLITVNRDLKHARLPYATNLQRAVLVYGVARYLEHAKNYPTIEKDVAASLIRPLRHHLARTHLAAHVARALATHQHAVNSENAFCYAVANDFSDYLAHYLKAAKLAVDDGTIRTFLPGLAQPLMGIDPLRWCSDKACEFARLSAFCWDEDALLPFFNEVAEKLKITPQEIETELRQISLRAARDSRQFNDFPAARFLMNPGKQMPIGALLFQREKTSASTSDKAPALDAPKAKKRQTSKHFDTEKLNKVSLLVEKAANDLHKLGSEKSTQARMLPYGLQLIITLMDARKTLFIAHPKAEKLIARIQVSAGKKPRALQLEIATAENRLLEKVLETGRSMHISAEKIERSKHLLDPNLSKFVGNNELYCLPLKVGRKIIGLILVCVDKQSTNQWSQHFSLTEAITKHMATALGVANGR